MPRDRLRCEVSVDGRRVGAVDVRRVPGVGGAWEATEMGEGAWMRVEMRGVPEDLSPLALLARALGVLNVDPEEVAR